MIAEIEFIRATISYSMEIHDRVTFTTILQSVVIPLHLANFTAGNLVSIAQLILHLALCSVLRRKPRLYLAAPWSWHTLSLDNIKPPPMLAILGRGLFNSECKAERTDLDFTSQQLTPAVSNRPKYEDKGWPAVAETQ
ncbi:hypothetical protein ACOSQ3_005927 [Xanthoceras sorbifolium]